jgi:transposase
MRAYSSELRERVLKAVDQGYHRNAIIRLLGVSRATIKRYLKQWRETATIQARSHPGRPAKKSVALRERMGHLVQERSDARLEDDCQIWEHRWGVKVSQASMSRPMRSAGDTRKKRQWQPANRTSRSERPGRPRLSSSMPSASCSLMKVAPRSLSPLVLDGDPKESA